MWEVGRDGNEEQWGNMNLTYLIERSGVEKYASEIADLNVLKLME